MSRKLMRRHLIGAVTAALMLTSAPAALAIGVDPPGEPPRSVVLGSSNWNTVEPGAIWHDRAIAID